MIPRKGEAMLAHVKKGLTKGCHTHAHTCTHAHAHMHKRQTMAAGRGGGASGFCTFAKGRFFSKQSMFFNTLSIIKKTCSTKDGANLQL